MDTSILLLPHLFAHMRFNIGSVSLLPATVQPLLNAEPFGIGDQTPPAVVNPAMRACREVKNAACYWIADR